MIKVTIDDKQHKFDSLPHSAKELFKSVLTGYMAQLGLYTHTDNFMSYAHCHDAEMTLKKYGYEWRIPEIYDLVTKYNIDCAEGRRNLLVTGEVMIKRLLGTSDFKNAYVFDRDSFSRVALSDVIVNDPDRPLICHLDKVRDALEESFIKNVILEDLSKMVANNDIILAVDNYELGTHPSIESRLTILPNNQYVEMDKLRVRSETCVDTSDDRPIMPKKAPRRPKFIQLQVIHIPDDRVRHDGTDMYALDDQGQVWFKTDDMSKWRKDSMYLDGYDD